LVYSAALTDIQRGVIERYLANKWGVTLAPTATNADAQAWINNVYLNGGTVSTATANAVNTFCNDIESAGIRDRFYRLNLFCGTGLSAALVPLFRGPSLGGTQYGNTTETNTNFVSGDFSESVGLATQLSATKHLNTGLAPDAIPAGVYQSMHLAAWHGTTGSADTDPTLIGAHNGATDRWQLSTTVRAAAAQPDSIKLGKTTNLNSTTTIQGARPAAFLLGTRNSATSLTMYRNGVANGVSATSTTGIAASSFPFFVFRNNLTGTASGDNPGFSLRMYSIGDDMTDTQVANFHTALSALNTALGRT
jgi:hypothetical protein